jgi:hypothetical protein
MGTPSMDKGGQEGAHVAAKFERLVFSERR